MDKGDVAKWGNSGKGAGIAAGGSDKCKTPLVRGGFWHCTYQQRKVLGRREAGDELDMDEIGKWGKPAPQLPAPQDYISTVIKSCHLKCDGPKFFLKSGTNGSFSCDMHAGIYDKQPTGECDTKEEPKPPPPPPCHDLTSKYGKFYCTGSREHRKCTLKCPAKWKSANGQYHFSCHYGHWDGRSDCMKMWVDPPPPPVKPPSWKPPPPIQWKPCKVPMRKWGDTGYWHCAQGPCLPVHGRKKREEGALEGRWGGPAQCLICNFQCDPIHKLKRGGRAQCRMSDGAWIEHQKPYCHFGHMCEWPKAGPMGYYECKDNLHELGYTGLPEEIGGLGHSSAGGDDDDHGFEDYESMDEEEKESNKREINWSQMEEVNDDDYEDIWYRKKRDTDSDKKSRKKEKKARKAAAAEAAAAVEAARQAAKAQSSSNSIGRWSPPPPEPRPPPKWWNAVWKCGLKCAKFHKPRNGQYYAMCKLDSSTWPLPPTECIYETPCATPSTPNGSFQCWETTILAEGEKWNGGKHRRSANETETEDFTPSPLGRWGPPKKPPRPDLPDFEVHKTCVLTCHDCYSPTSVKSKCVDGYWLDGKKPGTCTQWQQCADKPYWPIGNGYWKCKDYGSSRRCALQCYDYHIVQPVIPAIPPPDPSVGCAPYKSILNGWMECHMNGRKRRSDDDASDRWGGQTGGGIQCMIMCNKGFYPAASQAMATCRNGQYLPPQSGEFSWSCKKGTCNRQKWGEACWKEDNAPSMSKFSHLIGRREAEIDEEIDDLVDSEGLGRWGVQVQPVSVCNNCNGMWRNQIQCVFDTKCKDVPPHVPGGNAQCKRVMQGHRDYHQCQITCPKNHKAVCNRMGRKRREDGEDEEELDIDAIGKWGSTPAPPTPAPPSTAIMNCNAKTGEWDQRCGCEWNLKCEVPKRPNAQYTCHESNGIFECHLKCKGKGNYVPARWSDVWTFRCKRGIWIEKEPQGCVYEKPCEAPTCENGNIRNCRKAICDVPKRVLEEKMPGQSKHGSGLMPGATSSGNTPFHIGYTGRKRRDAHEDFTADGRVTNDDGSFIEYQINENGVAVTESADDEGISFVEPEEETEDEPRGLAAGRWGFNQFGRCPVNRGIEGGRLHCHTLGGIIGGGVVGMPPPMSHGCQEKNPITNGWMECKPNGGICMIMCNAGMVPYTRNLFAPCNNRQWNPSQWGCRPGHCNPAIYKEACWGVMHGRKRREGDDSEDGADRGSFDFAEGVSFENLDDESEQRSLMDRWMAPPPPPPPPPAHYVECSLSCHYGYRPKGSTSYKCDSRDGTFAPAVKGCYMVHKPKPKEPTVKAPCLKCDVKCKNWHRGGGHAECAKGYWYKVDECKKYGMCGKPDNPANGQYICLYEHEYGFAGDRKRRSADTSSIDYDRGDYEDENNSGWTGPDDYAKYYKNLHTQDRTEEADMMVGGYRWEQVKQKKMICNLACAKGYIPVQKQAVCIDGKWITKPSYCKKQHKCSAPPVSSYGKWQCRVESFPASMMPTPMPLPGPHGPPSSGPAPSPGGSCKKKNPIINGWMECKPNGGICMIMCNKGMVPLTTNLFSPCNGRKWNPNLWGCKRGHCDPSIYKEACWGVMHGRKRREADDSEEGLIVSPYVDVDENFDLDMFDILKEDHVMNAPTVSFGDEDAEEGADRSEFDDIGSDRWGQTQMIKMLVCKLHCYGGTCVYGSEIAKCDLETGYWHPTPGQCKPYPPQEKCVEPLAQWGSYKCYQVQGGFGGRKRREIGEDQSAALDFEDIWQDGKSGGGLGRWGQSYLVCDLTCDAGKVPISGHYTAKCDRSSGKWLVPPTNCKPTVYKPKCNQRVVNGGVINCLTQKYGQPTTMCHLQCADGFEPIYPDRTNFECNNATGGFTPQPCGCKAIKFPPEPPTCRTPLVDDGRWNCYQQDFDEPYPKRDRSDNFDHMRGRREADGVTWFFEEEFPVPSEVENTNGEMRDKVAARWGQQGPKPQNLVCTLQCNDGAFMSGSYLAVCRQNKNQWIIPPNGFCRTKPPAPKMCAKPEVTAGAYDCKKVIKRKRRSDDEAMDRWAPPVEPLLHCTLTCAHGYRPKHGRWHATCDYNTGLWQIPPTECVQDVRKCENTPSIHHGYLSCQSDRSFEAEQMKMETTTTTTTTTTTQPMMTTLDPMLSGFGFTTPNYVNHHTPPKTTRPPRTTRRPTTRPTRPQTRPTTRPTRPQTQAPTTRPYTTRPREQQRTEPETTRPAPKSTTTKKPSPTTKKPAPAIPIGAGGACGVEPAKNPIKGGRLSCRNDRHGNRMCMIKCDKGFRPWHPNLVIYCRNNVFYQRENPAEIQKNMKCKEGPCDINKYGVACANHPANQAARKRRDDHDDYEEYDDLDEAVDESNNNDLMARWGAPDQPMKRCQVTCNKGYEVSGSAVAECDLKSGSWAILPGQCEKIPANPLGCTTPGDVPFGQWKCWITSDAESMRGALDTAPPEGSDEYVGAKKQKEKSKKKAKDRGLFDHIPGPSFEVDEFESEALRAAGFDPISRKSNSLFLNTLYFILKLSIKENVEIHIQLPDSIDNGVMPSLDGVHNTTSVNSYAIPDINLRIIVSIKLVAE